ncbi:hypothetical protein L5515_001053 [Caenorhabditis briggsae]|uniref:Rab3-GAP regulatory subunit N-terminal domain-containing protein n=2 Tax=Caenorhabditis briggsae TaxID=6238 RepID=A0AAE9E1P3_CAEBR|nr:hypothetical protein L5515_001053 [Caenorhabditis briggsae]
MARNLSQEAINDAMPIAIRQKMKDILQKLDLDESSIEYIQKLSSDLVEEVKQEAVKTVNVRKLSDGLQTLHLSNDTIGMIKDLANIAIEEALKSFTPVEYREAGLKSNTLGIIDDIATEAVNDALKSFTNTSCSPNAISSEDQSKQGNESLPDDSKLSGDWSMTSSDQAFFEPNKTVNTPQRSEEQRQCSTPTPDIAKEVLHMPPGRGNTIGLKNGRFARPYYFDLVKVPGGDKTVTDAHLQEFMSKVRSRKMILPTDKVSEAQFQAVVRAKQTWCEDCHPCTIVPTHGTEILTDFLEKNQKQLATIHLTFETPLKSIEGTQYEIIKISFDQIHSNLSRIILTHKTAFQFGTVRFCPRSVLKYNEMSVTRVNLEAYCGVSDEVAKQVKKYLLGDSADESRFERKNSDSSDGNETQFCKTTERKENVEEWDDWGDKQDAENTTESDESMRNWLFRCDLKTYSDAEYLLVTWESRFVLLRKPPDENQYKIVCKQYIEGDPVGNEITASCIFGLTNVRHIELLDSIIIALGTLDGHVYFFTEQGTMLYYDRFSIFEPVNSLQFDVVKTGQTFLVVFTKGFFMVNPISLKSVLYQCKVLIAKGEKTVKQISESIELQSELLAPDIKGNIIHVVFTGLQKPSTFEQYVSASYDSFYAKVEKPSLPLYSTFMVTTEKEFAVFVWHDREEQEKLLDDVIKYGKSLVPSFGIRKFFGISTEPTRVASHMRSAVHAPTRSLILETRIAQTVSRSPDCNYVAVTDRLARVIIIDVINRQVVLIFKGYRDASVSWVSSTQDDRFAQFLTIFAPRRSLLEVWTVLGNVRVCAQHVPSSECNVVSGGENKMLCGRCHMHTDYNSFFIDEKGEFHRIVMPFHLALTSRARQDQHDHLRLKELEHQKVGSGDWFKTFSDLRMTTSRKITFQNALHGLSTAEEAHNFIARIKSLPNAGSLADLPNVAEKSIGFYARIVAESKPAIGEYEKKSAYELDSIVKRILECHMERFGERSDAVNDSLKVGEWLKHVDLSHEDIDVFSEHWSENRRLLLANLIFAPLLGSFQIDEYYDTVLEKLPVNRQNIVKLFYLKLNKSTNKIDWRIFNRIVELFVNLEKSETGVFESVDRMAMDSKNVTLGILLLAVCWCARKQMRQLKHQDKCSEDNLEESEHEEEEHEGNEEKNKTFEEWDAVSPEVEHLDSIMMCLHCVALAQSLIDEDPCDVRISDVAQRIDSYIRENVAKWVVNESIETEVLEKLFPRDPTEVLAEEGDEEDRRNKMIVDFPEDKETIVERMYQMIPRVFEHDLVVAGKYFNNRLFLYSGENDEMKKK